MNFFEEFIVVNLHFLVPLLIMALLMFYFKGKEHFFSVFYSGILACFINFFIIFIMYLIRVYIYKNRNSGFININCVIIYDFVLRFHIFAFFNIILKILIFKFLLKDKDIADFTKAFYFSIGSGFLTNPFCRIFAVGSWFTRNIEVLKFEFILLGISSLFLFIFEFCFSFFVLCIIKRKMIFFSPFFVLMFIAVYGFIFFLLRMPDIGMIGEFSNKYDVSYSLYNLKFEDEFILGTFLIFMLMIIAIISILKKFLKCKKDNNISKF